MCLYLLAILAFKTVAASSPVSDRSFDFIVVGGGTSGLVVANRLSESPDAQVLVIEAGYSALDNENSTFPELSGSTETIDWRYQSAPQIYAYDRVEPLPGGKGIGGSTLINGMVYTRAEKTQIDAWEEVGNQGWRWDTLFPYYKKSQHLIPPGPRALEAGVSYEPAFHGLQGPVNTGWPRFELVSKYLPALNESYAKSGVPWNADPAGGETRGFGTYPWEKTPGNDTYPDTRADAGRSYYYPYQNRVNLHMMSGTTALKLLWASLEDDNVIAGAVQVLTDSGETVVINASQEIILAAGTYRTPALLEYSGVGNSRMLSTLGINTTIDLPGVGENLNDQIRNILNFNVPSNVTYNGTTSALAYVTIDDLYGPNASDFTASIEAALPSYAAAIAARNSNATSEPDVLEFLRVQARMLFDAGTPAMELRHLSGGGGLGCEFWGTMPFARGSVHINSTTSPPTGGVGGPNLPLADPAYWMLDYDTSLQVAASRYVRKLYLHTAPLRGLVTSEGYPGLGAVPEEASDELWARWSKQNMRSAYHGIGSAIMLPRGKGGVVDPRCRVYGTGNVRVVDASVIPFQTNGHTSSTVYAVAERCSDLIKSDLGMLST